jgi:hypothetical protein
VTALTNAFRELHHYPARAKLRQEIAMDRELGVSIVVALVLAIVVKVLMPSATAAGIDLAQSQTRNELSRQPDLSWLVSP